MGIWAVCSIMSRRVTFRHAVGFPALPSIPSEAHYNASIVQTVPSGGKGYKTPPQPLWGGRDQRDRGRLAPTSSCAGLAWHRTCLVNEHAT